MYMTASCKVSFTEYIGRGFQRHEGRWEACEFNFNRVECLRSNDVLIYEFPSKTILKGKASGCSNFQKETMKRLVLLEAISTKAGAIR